MANNGTAEKRAAFIEALREKGSVYHAAKTVRVGRTTVYQWRKNLPGFAQEWDNAIEDAADELEASLYQQGIKGNVTAALGWLNANRPEKYQRTQRLEHSGPDGAPIPFQVIDKVVRDANGDA